MAFKTVAQLASQADVQDADLLPIYRGTGPLKSVAASIVANYVVGSLGGTSGHKFGFLDAANTWSSAQTHAIATAITAQDYLILKPTDFGTSKPGLFLSKTATAGTWQIGLYDGTSFAGELDFALTLLKILGAFSVTGAASVGGALTVTGAATIGGVLTVSAGGLNLTGGTVQNVNAVAALSIDWSAADIHTKSISANSTFTFTGITAAKASAILLDLTISSAAVPTWPVAVKWAGGTAPTLGNGRHLLGFVTTDGGTTVIGTLSAKSVA